MQDVMRKLKNHRIMYSRELHKIKGSQRSQAGTDDVEYSTWVIFSSLDVFLHPHVTMRASISWCILNMQLPPKANGDLHAGGLMLPRSDSSRGPWVINLFKMAITQWLLAGHPDTHVNVHGCVSGNMR